MFDRSCGKGSRKLRTKAIYQTKRLHFYIFYEIETQVELKQNDLRRYEMRTVRQLHQ